MGSPNFRFKQFTVWHDRCAMKVGTDGVLLGAWCPLPEESTGEAVLQRSALHILDIGTGCGLIALMLAQRLSCLYTLHHTPYTIDAIDIDANAVEQAQYNFEQSPWSAHLHAHHSILQEWELKVESLELKDKGYHLIVSNPPYFQQSLKNPNAQRATARHTDTLDYSELIAHSVRLLNSNGTLALVLPIEAEAEILALAKQYGLTPTHITHVHSKPGKSAKRLLIAFRFLVSAPHSLIAPSPNTFYIESADSPRSDEYKALTQDFYL